MWCSCGVYPFTLLAILFVNCLFVHSVVCAGDDTRNEDGNSGCVDVEKSYRHRDVYESAGPRRHIHIIRKRSVHVNGVEIDEHTLLDHLEQHERELIFGGDNKKRSVKLVSLRQSQPQQHRPTDVHSAEHKHTHTFTSQTEQHKVQRVQKRDTVQQTARTTTYGGASPAAATASSSQNAETKTERRLNGADASQEVSVQIQDDSEESTVNLYLQQAPKLIDDSFVFIRRYANTTQFIEDSHKLAEKYERCFYRDVQAALDLCDEDNVRGVFHHNATDYLIHPLPERFGNATHVIFEADKNRSTRLLKDDEPQVPSQSNEHLLDEHLQFEPDEEEFNEPNVVDVSPGDIEENTRSPRNIHLPFKLRYHNDDHHYKHHHRQRHGWKSKHHNTHHKHKKSHHNNHHHLRRRRFISSASDWKSPQVLHIETAIFVDSDLFKHMAKNFPRDTESHLIRFVLAMINGVQLLYHHPSLGRRVNFVLKRLEILYKDPKDLRRSSDIDTYLSNFCMWQKSLNPSSDSDAVHYDHAVILTGLDLYVVAKNGMISSQVVGLAPVAGMCTPTSSCTINEGKHFESVFVVAHEIGHNLGMRHDSKENSCDPSLYIMSPTLGSGKITWSKCSRTYLNTFLESNQARCLLDRGQFLSNLDHAAEGLLPGERFDANQQCMLKYGRDSVKAPNQQISDICRDLHCQRERYTWTSHPALEGTVCGDNMWCRSGVCAARPTVFTLKSETKQYLSHAKPGYDKTNFVESTKMGHLLHEYNYNKAPTWGEWGEASECDSGCLYGPSKRLREGSTGLKTYSRSCLEYRRRCSGRDRKFESCVAKQCYSIEITTIDDFAAQVCEKAQKFDAELTGEGQQIVGDIEESCKVFCKTKSNGTKSRSWTFPDGTTCRSKQYTSDDTAYCIAGRCEKFSCDNSTNNYYKIDPIFCQYRHPQHFELEDKNRRSSNSAVTPSRYAESSVTYNRGTNVVYGPTTVRSKIENEVAVRSFHGLQHEPPYRRKAADTYQPPWNKYNYRLNDQPQAAYQPPQPPAPPQPPVSASLVAESDWVVKSGCHSSCIAKSKGIQVVQSRRTGANNIQLCTHAVKPCDRVQTAADYAENTCSRYKLKVRGLSGHGNQIAASIDEPDRSCRVGCQDEYIKYRFYLVNGRYGHFPLGTKCSNTDERYCVNGKCLEFGVDNIPLQESHVNLALYRSKRSAPARRVASGEAAASLKRSKRSFLYYDPVNITETLTQDFINNIVSSIMKLDHQIVDDLISGENIEFTNPIYIQPTDELNSN